MGKWARSLLRSYFLRLTALPPGKSGKLSTYDYIQQHSSRATFDAVSFPDEDISQR
jgi:hypothetical protein